MSGPYPDTPCAICRKPFRVGREQYVLVYNDDIVVGWVHHISCPTDCGDEGEHRTPMPMDGPITYNDSDRVPVSYSVRLIDALTAQRDELLERARKAEADAKSLALYIRILQTPLLDARLAEDLERLLQKYPDEGPNDE